MTWKIKYENPKERQEHWWGQAALEFIRQGHNVIDASAMADMFLVEAEKRFFWEESE